ncbi:hypothetical protein DNTS_012176 [Danionella cerebrum]|uniref:Ig-like domain-containing protein n=1 Tax=Danionella cerebrum TaxID=2873325 RepID=A0A553QV22_9TELE|nr:hypothetical protein DNTS_012176 [Danionella translucida]
MPPGFLIVSVYCQRCLTDGCIEELHLDQNMKIFLLHIHLWVWYHTAECLTNKSVALGDNVTLSCELDNKDMVWFIQKCPDPPERILRTFDAAGNALYSNITLKQKYSAETNSSLLIRNITFDDSGVYYCVKLNEPAFSNGIKIYINEDKNEPHDTNLWIILASALLNVLLATALIGFCKSYIWKRKSDSEDLQSTTAVQTESQYDEVEFSTIPSRNCYGREQIYSLLQPTQPM